MVASIKHVSHHVLGTEGDEYTPWSWLPPAHQHKPPCPRTNTKSAQSLATHHCGQKRSAESTGIAGSGHSMYRERMSKCQPTCKKGCLEAQPMEMTLISLIPKYVSTVLSIESYASDETPQRKAYIQYYCLSLSPQIRVPKWPMDGLGLKGLT